MSQQDSSNFYFRLIVVAGSLFALTALAMFASSLGDPAAPPNRFFDQYGLLLLGVETVAVVGVSILALSVDRRQTLSRQQDRHEQSNPPPDAP